MTEVAHLVSGIEFKLGKLIGRHLQLRKENEELTREISGLKEMIEGHEKTIRELEDKLKALRIAKTIEKKEGTVEAKLKINELVREIDRCIGLLNA
ncbi:MAG TPA: hypothetical protein PKG48_02840 [Bacteroidales bacterium]|nr:hypothetical protein [Bacteroidales bacterium]HPS61789.1 hypothetical protein [Bacteroidales bacterium]